MSRGEYMVHTILSNGTMNAIKMTVFIFILIPCLLHAKKTQKNNTITSGDIVRIEIPQDNEFSSTHTINNNGYLVLSFGEPLYVEGTPINSISLKIKNHLQHYYADVSLIEVMLLKKMVRAKITGHVYNPGWYNVPSGADVQELITVAGGLKDGAIIDNLLIHSKLNGSTATYNFKNFLENGQDSTLYYIQQNDVIFVPMSPTMGNVQRTLMSYIPPPDETRDNVINVLGQVYKPGAYEVNTDVTVLDMIAMAGGPKEPGNPNKVMDLDNIRVIRNSSTKTQVYKFSLNTYFQTGNPELLIHIKAGDNILIPSKKADVEDETKSVVILGAVFRPNSYEISDKIQLTSLLANAGGFLKQQGVTVAKSDSITIIYSNKNPLEKHTTFNLDAFMEMPRRFSEPILSANDIVIVHRNSNSNLLEQKEQFHVNIIGEVHKPGRTPIRKGENILDALARAGGPKLETADYRITLVRVYNGKKLHYTFDMESFYSDSENEPLVHCNTQDHCNQSIPTILSGDHLFIDRKDEIEISWWLDFVWKAATVGIFILATWSQVGNK